MKSSVKCAEHSEEVFPGTQFFLLSRTKFTHWFHLCLFYRAHFTKKRNSDVVFWILNIVTKCGNAPFQHLQPNVDNSEAKFPLVFKSDKSRPKSRVPEPTS